METKHVAVAVVVILIIIFVAVYFLMNSGDKDYWSGTWTGLQGPYDKVTITGKPGSYQMTRVNGEVISAVYNGDTIIAFGQTAKNVNGVVRWPNGNVWTRS